MTLCWLRRLVVLFALTLGSSAVGAVSHDQLVAAGASISKDAGGAVRFVGYGAEAHAKLPVNQALQALKPEAASLQLLAAHAELFGIKNPATDVKVLKHRADVDGRAMTRYQQVVGGVPVIGGELIVNQSSSRKLMSIGGKTSAAQGMKTQPVVTAEQASSIALHKMMSLYKLRADEVLMQQPTLSVFDPKLFMPSQGKAALVWRFAIKTTRTVPVNEFLLVDALTGDIPLHFNQAPRARNRLTYDANNVGTVGTLVCDEFNPSCAGGSVDAVQAHTYAGNTYNFYQTNFGRDGIDNAGMDMVSRVRICPPGETCPYGNAYWDGVQMSYGQGFAAGEDVVAHELTHGVTEHESNLMYLYQPGAINESLSDVFGEFVQQSNAAESVPSANRWLIGEGLSGVGPFRSMADPTRFGDPDRMGSPLYHTASWDNGGVHINSGVGNKAAYLMVDGGVFNGRQIQPIGLAKAAQIFYRAQTHLLFSSSDYLDLYNALNQACQDLLGPRAISATDCGQVNSALLAVEMNGTTQTTATLTLTKTGMGSITTSATDGLNCGTSCTSVSGTYPVGSTLTLTPTPATGSIFLGWGGACAGFAPCTVALGGPTNVTASFGPGIRINALAQSNLSQLAAGAEARFAFNVPSGATNLVVSISGGTGDADLYLRKGTPPTRTFLGYDCAPLTYGNDEVCAVATPGAETYHLLLYAYTPYAGVSLHVSYVIQPTLSIAKTGGGAGAVVSNIGGIVCGTDCEKAIPAGAVVTLSATPSAGSVFAGWSGGGCSGTGTCTLSVNADTTVTASFNRDPNYRPNITPILMLLLD